MSKIHIPKLRKILHNHSITDTREEGVKLIRPILKNKNCRDYPDLFLDFAFLLYHVALKNYWNVNSPGKITAARRKIKEATKILKKLISLEEEIGATHKTIINAKIFLAQIYAIEGNVMAIALAKENFRKNSNSLMANRMADVYQRLGKLGLAAKWYKKYARLGRKEKTPKYHLTGVMANFYKNIGRDKLAREYLKKTLCELPNNKIGASMRSVLKSNFPNDK